MTDNVTQTLSQKMQKYAQLARNRSELEARLRKADNEKTSVRDDIYERVRREYEAMLEIVLKELIPLQTEIEGSVKEWSQQLKETESRAKELHEKLEEVTFRHRVGEFDADHFSKLESALTKQISELSRLSADLRGRLEQFDAVKAGSRPAAGPATAEKAVSTPADSAPRWTATPEPARPRTPAPPIAPQPSAPRPTGKSPETTSVPLGKTTDAPTPAVAQRPERKPDTEDVIDIASWAQEFQKDRAPKVTARPERKATPDAVQPSPAKPRPTAAPTVAAPSRAPAPSSGASPRSAPTPSNAPSPMQSGFPVLIIVGGPGSGKKLPLVPMTMTVGREHDNNIELKDEDVARYHARISFQRGQYILEDLESSTGTWVNDERITETTLKQGDKIRVGATELVIDFE